MPVRGNGTAELDKLRQQLSDRGLKARLLQSAASEALTQVQLGFREQRDPLGEPWQPLKSSAGMRGSSASKPAKRAKTMILRDTGRLGNSFTSHATPSGFVVGTNVTYATYHQEGTRGRRSASSRKQAVDSRGRFTIEKPKRSKNKSKVAGHVTINYQAGSGAIPVRMMVAPGGQLTPIWQRAIDAAADGVMRKHFGK